MDSGIMSKPVNSCVLKNLFGGSSAIKKSPKNSGNALFDSLVMSGFQNLMAVKLKPRILVNSLIHYLINLRPKVLRKYFLHCTPTGTCLWLASVVILYRGLAGVHFLEFMIFID